MASKNLSSIITVGTEDYNVTALTAKNAENAEKLGGEPANSYATQTFVNNKVAEKQDKLVSGTNIKTINNQSILGDGNINIEGGGGISDVASKIKVTMDDNSTKDATITIKSDDPDGGNIGDIWFKYSSITTV